mmetsp:Transcript_10152/g.15269  ORF Transcript_10152/g.15269 Transcript_10152/m.15269 type:complete len:320 (-) Transcript_10152:10-969(-)
MIFLALGIDPSSDLIDRNLIISFLSIFIILPVSLLKDLHNLSITSLISVLSSAFLVVIIACASPRERIKYLGLIDTSETFVPIRSSVFSGFGAISFAFVCQSSSFILYRSLKDGERTIPVWKRVSNISLGISYVMTLVMAVSGYLSFGNAVQGDIVNNFSKHGFVATVARMFLSIAMLLTYPMEMVVARHTFDSSLFKRMLGMGEPSFIRHALVTTLVWSATTITALSVANLGIVLEIVGAFSSSILGYVLPPVMYLKAHKEHILSLLTDSHQDGTNKHWFEVVYSLKPYYVAFLMTIFGLVSCLAGTISTIVDEASGI